MKALAALAVTAVLATGCYKARIQLQPAMATGYGPEHLHVGVIGIIEVSSPIDMAAACGGPQNVVEVYDHVGLLAGIVNLIANTIFPVFYIWNGRVGCAVMGPPPMAPQPELPPELPPPPPP